MSRSNERELVRRHLGRMRAGGIAVATTLPVAAAAVFLVPRLQHTLFGPGATTVLAAAVALWVGFTANRDARRRLERVKRAFAVHGDLERLLRDHLLVYLVVLLRLDLIACCGLLVAVWGVGRTAGLSFTLLAAILMATAWPTEHKTRLLIARARELRPDGE
jgi:hypothetical protein